jgi:AraC family transcriptional regulator, transcriptional activator FtrA
MAQCSPHCGAGAIGSSDRFRYIPAMLATPFPPIPVAVLALSGVIPFDLVIPGQIFGDPVPILGAVRYRLLLCGATRGLLHTAGDLPVGVPFGLEALAEAHTIVVPGIQDVEAPLPPEALAALRAAAERGARIASICTGAFVLAAAGLLDGRRATTHWAHAARLAERYPRVEVDAKVLYVDEGQVLTSAGMAAGIDLCLHLVRRDYGAEVANAIARLMVVAPHRSGGQAQYIEQPLPDRRASGLERTLAWACENLDRPLTVAGMARHAAMSIRHFTRRFQAETGSSPLRWLLSQRVLAARRLLETTDLSVEQVAAGVGFGSAASLRVHFQREVRTSPLQYRRTFRGSGGGATAKPAGASAAGGSPNAIT